MAAHSTACGAGCGHRAPAARPRARIACHANHAAAAANTARQAVPGTGLRPGSSIPAMATPIRTCSPSASSSVSLPRRRQTARRPAQYTATMIMSAAKPPASQAGPLMRAAPEPRAPWARAAAAGARVALAPRLATGRWPAARPAWGIYRYA
jgi:hypothetical protein